MAEKAELVIAALQQRIGELVSNYETQIAVLRADLTQLVDERNAKEEAIKDYSISLDNLTN
jgi:cell division protein FtsB